MVWVNGNAAPHDRWDKTPVAISAAATAIAIARSNPAIGLNRPLPAIRIHFERCPRFIVPVLWSGPAINRGEVFDLPALDMSRGGFVATNGRRWTKSIARPLSVNERLEIEPWITCRRPHANVNEIRLNSVPGTMAVDDWHHLSAGRQQTTRLDCRRRRRGVRIRRQRAARCGVLTPVARRRRQFHAATNDDRPPR